MPARWVIHAVGPNYALGQRDPNLLRSAYARSLQVADDLGAASVAFPLISAGIYSWPLDDAIDIAITTLRTTPTDVTHLRIVSLDNSIHDRINGALSCEPATVDALFTPPPDRWGLRGDPHLWAKLGQDLADVPVTTAADVRQLVVAQIQQRVGAAPAAQAEPVYVRELDPGHGLSAGMVDLAWWHSVGLPLLEQRAGRA